jgi:hypothetical protein
MAHLAGLKSLRSLTVMRCGMDNTGVEHISGLAGLESLNLHADPGVTDASIASLKKLAALKTLNVGETGISDDGLTKLRTALPACKFTRD